MADDQKPGEPPQSEEPATQAGSTSSGSQSSNTTTTESKPIVITVPAGSMGAAGT